MTSLAHPSFLLSYLERLGKRPKKSLSQNFLVDLNTVERVLSLSQISSDDCVLEIGPGPGVFSDEIIKTGARYVAIELDDVFAQELQKRYQGHPRVEIYNQDFLNFDLEQVQAPKKLKVISNLPFQLTSPILDRLLSRSDIISSCTLIMQKEVALRLSAKEKTKAYSSLSLFTQLYCQVGKLITISNHCYFPKPGVETSAIHLNIVPCLIDHPKELMQLIKAGFAKRRKMLTSNLPYPKDAVQSVLETLGASSKARAEELTLDQWNQLYKALEELR